MTAQKRPLRLEEGWGQNVGPPLRLLNCAGSTISEHTCPGSLLFECQFCMFTHEKVVSLFMQISVSLL
jgi:hypothetical protein